MNVNLGKENASPDVLNQHYYGAFSHPQQQEESFSNGSGYAPPANRKRPWSEVDLSKGKLMKVHTHNALGKPLSEQTICNHCDVLVACSIWEVNGQLQQSCLDCQIGQHGGWPKPGLLPLTHMTDTHRKLMAKMCSKKANPDMPNIPK